MNSQNLIERQLPSEKNKRELLQDNQIGMNSGRVEGNSYTYIQDRSCEWIL